MFDVPHQNIENLGDRERDPDSLAMSPRPLPHFNVVFLRVTLKKWEEPVDEARLG